MAQVVSSAEPEKLFEYAKRGRWTTFHLDMESSHLASRLQRFESLCTEPALRVRTDQLANRLRNFSDECKPIDDWVEQVGKEFLLADQSKNSTEMPSANMCVPVLISTSLPVPESVRTPASAKDNNTQNSSDTIEVIHTFLDVAGFVPLVGEVADAINGAIYLAEGRKVEAAISFLSMIPLGGDIFFKGGKYGYRGIQWGARRTAREGLEELTQHNIKKNVDEFLRFGELPANSLIKRNGYEYTTDQFGRTTSVSGKLRLDTGVRTDHQTQVGRMGLPGDEGGHLIGARFDGPPEGFNIVPQNAQLNRGQWKAMENEWATALEAGKEVNVNIVVRYGDNTLRPDVFEVRYYVDGLERIQFFRNLGGG